MEDTLKITLAQLNIVWENPAANLEKLESLLAPACKTDLIIFPEMFTTGFSMDPEKLCETMDGQSVSWMKSKAASLNAAVTGSLIIKDGGKIWNRSVWANPDGAVFWYDKRHLYTMGGENQHYSAGAGKLIVEYKGWRICPLICYDLRFPVWSRNVDNYDILIYSANWPSARHHVWKNLLAARAIENQAYCFGVNRAGTDGTGLQYLGGSGMSDPKGFPVFLGVGEQLETFEISYSGLADFRKKFPLLGDKDDFTINT